MSNSIPREKEKTSKPLNVMQAILDNLAWIIVTVVVGIVLLVGGAILTHKPFYTVSAVGNTHYIGNINCLFKVLLLFISIL